MSCPDRRVEAYLLELARVEGLTVGEASQRLCLSRQGLYKVLRELRGGGYVEEGPVIRLSEKGREELGRTLRDLLRYFHIDTLRLAGVVVSGLGEGAFYMSLEGYRTRISQAFGFDPYPGTLNVRLDPSSLPYRRYLDALPGIAIPGFTNALRTYGGVKGFRATLGGIRGAVIMPERTHHPPDIVEVIAPVKLREVLGLKDGDRVEIAVELF